MSNLDDALRSPDDVPKHPVVQWLISRIAAHDEIRIDLRWDSSSFGSAVSGIYVLRKENGEMQPPASYDWDDDLNTAMINLGIKAVDVRVEGQRFARALRAALRKVERRYGDGYMNAVLIDLIDESNLGKDGDIGRIRRAIHTNSAERGQSYNACRDAIAIEIGGRAKELRDKLDYNPEELKTVMDKAIAQYLDERFSVTRMLKLGWIDESGHTTK